MIEIFNVLVKGVEIKINPTCKAFLKEEDARKWCEEVCKRKSWVIKSTFGWNDDNNWHDYRVKDVEGNTYYFVIYKQELN
jgi:hypothetical protein